MAPPGIVSSGLDPLAVATPLIGRAQDLLAIEALLAQGGVRILTLLGPGGAGKTRLSIEIARRARDRVADVWFVPLAAIRDPAHVAPAIAAAIGVEEIAGRSVAAGIRAALDAREGLIVLDNFEQVLAAAPIVADVFGGGRVKVVVTSRAALRLYGEQEFAVPPLGLPDRATSSSVSDALAFGAVEFFLARARAVRPDFALSEENREAVVEICAALDGLPLAIELAAARIKLLPPQSMRGRLGNRLALLTGGPRDRPDRQRTLRATIDWSFELLNADEQRALVAIAVFVGSFDLAAAQAVLGDEIEALEILGSLHDKNLLRLVESDEEPRFSMLATIREYATERLIAAPDVQTLRRRYAEHFLARAERRVPELETANPVAALEAFERDHVELRAALAWALEQDGALAQRFAEALTPFWSMHSHLAEGRRALERVLATSAGARTIARATTLLGAGWMAHYQADHPRARVLFEEATSIASALGDRATLAMANARLAAVALQESRWAESRALYEQALAIAHAIGAERLAADALAGLALLELYAGDPARAVALYDDVLATRTRLRQPAGEASARMNAGHAHYRAGDDVQAARAFEDGFSRWQALATRAFMAECLQGLAAIEARAGRSGRAAKLWGAARRLVEETGYATDPIMRPIYERVVTDAARQLGERAFTASEAQGHAVPTEMILQGDAAEATLLGDAAIPGSAPPARVPVVVAPSLLASERYAIESVLGEGGMGRVYKAWDTRLARYVALKVLLVRDAARAARTLDAVDEERLVREARAAAALSHPNVVGVFDVGTIGSQPYIAMEFVEGRSLRRIVSEGVAAVAMSTRIAWLADAARALAAAHRAGVLHRDVKPDNLVVRDDGVLKVLDFGIARAPKTRGSADHDPLEGVRAGTPMYMAPEQVRGDPLDARVDQFAWGVTAYELLAGVPPWPADHLLGVFAAVLTQAPMPLPPDVPPHVASTVLRALEKSPEARHASMDDVAAALAAVLSMPPPPGSSPGS